MCPDALTLRSLAQGIEKFAIPFAAGFFGAVESDDSKQSILRAEFTARPDCVVTVDAKLVTSAAGKYFTISGS